MSDNSKIELTDATWSPIRARFHEIQDDGSGKERIGWHCEHISEGCRHCYAETINRRLGTGLDFKPGEIYRAEREGYRNGEAKLFLDEKMLLAPLRWKKPRMIFVCSMTDLFADFVPDEWIDRVFAVMALAPQHIFQVLTKRAGRMREYCSDPQAPFRVAQATDALTVRRDIGPEEIRPIADYPGYFASSHGFIYSEKRGARKCLSPDLGEEGHQRVQLHREGKETRHGDRLLVHRIILETFVGPAPIPDAQGRHRDRNPANNAASNLLWGDQSANWDDAKRHGSHRRYSKLTQPQADEIRRRHAAGESGEALAREFDVSSTQIRNIAAGKQWAIEAPIQWPLTNVWKGVSTERQQEADERIPLLLQTPAAVRFISAEPLLGPIDLTQAFAIAPADIPMLTPEAKLCADPTCGREGRHYPREFGCRWGLEGEGPPQIDWVIVGGESGPNARPMHPTWARSLRDQCEAAGVAYFFNSERLPKHDAGRLLDGVLHNAMPTVRR